MRQDVTVPAFVSVKDAARYLAISRSKLYELLAAGELPSMRIGRSRRIAIDDLTAFADACRQPVEPFSTRGE